LQFEAVDEEGLEHQVDLIGDFDARLELTPRFDVIVGRIEPWGTSRELGEAYVVGGCD